jgi:hypothetical protein
MDNKFDIIYLENNFSQNFFNLENTKHYKSDSRCGRVGPAVAR